MKNSFDVLIVGAGVIGSAIARELSRYDLKTAVFEKESDVAAGASGRNSGVVHTGFNNRPGTLMAKLCVEGSMGFEKTCRELGVPYKKTGKIVVALEKKDEAGIRQLLDNGKKNGVLGLKIITADEIKKLEPNINGSMAMLSRETAITNPFLYTVALAESAALNGVKFFFHTEVCGIEKANGLFKVTTSGGVYESRYLVNSAGLYSDRISSMAGDSRYRIYPCRGEYFILDKRTANLLNAPIYPAPRFESGGLGTHLTPTIEGNILIGPSAEYINEKNDYASTQPIMKKLFEEAEVLLPQLSPKHVIRSYTGIRSKLLGPESGGFGDFVIEESDVVENLINLVGIESPGFTASVPIAEMVSGIICKKEPLRIKHKCFGERARVIPFRDMKENEKRELIRGNPDYGEIICRCEGITRKEVIDAIENPLGVKTLAGIKYRCRAMMGRCQGGYCLSRIVDIMINEYGMKLDEITERGGNSVLFTGKVKQFR